MGAKSSQVTTGSLQNLHLTEIAQIVSLGRKTGCVRLASGRREGEIWFHDGAMVHAWVGDRLGEPALFELLGWRSGCFRIEHGSTTVRRTIDNDTMYLLMEGLRLADEASHSAAGEGEAQAPKAPRTAGRRSERGRRQPAVAFLG